LTVVEALKFRTIWTFTCDFA